MIWDFKENVKGEIVGPEEFYTAAVQGRAVALGYFDGVHAGHRVILEKLCYQARKRNLSAMVHTFSALPKSKAGDPSEKDNLLLTTVAEKCSFFERMGLDEAAFFPFSETVSGISALDFLNRYLKDILHAKVIVAGQDYRFGHNRKGDMDLLKEWGAENGVDVFPVPPLQYKDHIISSTWIRECIRNGEITLANTLLGYPISFRGKVQEGRHLGRTLSFPTANISIEEGKVIPAYGVYASVLHTAGKSYAAITNVGLRPTVNSTDPVPLIETTMYDHQMDLYGQEIRVSLLSFVRPEQKFRDIQALRQQVQKDMAEVRQYHGMHGMDYSNLEPVVI